MKKLSLTVYIPNTHAHGQDVQQIFKRIAKELEPNTTKAEGDCHNSSGYPVGFWELKEEK